MTAFIIQTALLIAIAFIIGCLIGCFLKRMFGESDEPVSNSTIVSSATVATGSAVAAKAMSDTAKPVAPQSPPKAEPATLEVKPSQAKAPVLEPEEKVSAPPAKAEPVSALAQPVPAKKAAPRKSPPKKTQPRKTTASKSSASRKVSSPVQKDDLKRIRGIGRQNEARLNAEGVTSFAQIGAWTKKDQAHWGERLAFPGRIEREEWVKQAKVLAKGGQTEFSKRVAKGEVATSLGKGKVTASRKSGKS